MAEVLSPLLRDASERNETTMRLPLLPPRAASFLLRGIAAVPILHFLYHLVAPLFGLPCA